MKTDATQPTQLVQYWRDSDKEDNEISKKVSDENICNILSDFSLTDSFFLSCLTQLHQAEASTPFWISILMISFRSRILYEIKGFYSYVHSNI